MRKYQCLQVGVESSGAQKLQMVSRSVEDLPPGDVLIRSHYSSLNYKDALAVTGAGKILRSYPMTPGIDVCGVVEQSADSRFQVGEEVLVTGCGLGESRDGGLAEFVRVPGDWVIRLPQGLDLWESMALGTAGFTAALALSRLEFNGLSPQKGPVLVTGASGGVGSFAVNILAQNGYHVVAASSRAEFREYLLKLGAKEVVSASELHLGSRPLESTRWAAAFDNVGGDILAGILRHIDLWGAVAAIGLAAGSEFSSTVMPFILRGVSLLGVSSSNCPQPLRGELWEKLGIVWKPQHLQLISQHTVDLAQVPEVCQKILSHQHHGRTVVKLIN